MDIPQRIALLLLVALGSTVNGQMSFWISTTDDVSVGSSVGETPDIMIPRGAEGTFHIWAKPDPGETLQNVALNVTSTSETAIEFDSAVFVNDGRFGSVYDTSHGLDIDDQSICQFPAPLHGIWGALALSIDPDSGTGLNAASPGGDIHYDATNGTWHLASVGYTALANGTTSIFLEIGKIGMNYEGDTAGAMQVRFGSLADATLSNDGVDNDRCEPSATSEATIEVVDPILGDFNLNAVLDPGDIDLLSIEVLAGTDDAFYELTGNASVDQADRVLWVETLVGTNFGDTNLDGLVDFADFLNQSGGFGKAIGWAFGDTDGDLIVGFADFLELSSNFGTGELFEPAAAVPEPTGHGVYWLCLVCLTRCRGGRDLEIETNYRI